jgi:hypothetical protein
MLVWLASYPRSGNTFLRLVLRNRYAIASNCSEWRCDAPPPRNFARTAFLAPGYSDPDDPVVASVIGMKTHSLPPNDTDRAVYIVRDGRDSLVSHAYFILTDGARRSPDRVPAAQVAAMVRELIRGSHPGLVQRIRLFVRGSRPRYGTWSENVEAWTSRPNTVVIRFEELVERPGPVADRIVEELGLDIPVVSEVVPTFRELSSASPSFFRKGATGAWPEVFTPELHAMFWKYHGRTMTRLGYAHAVYPLREAA